MHIFFWGMGLPLPPLECLRPWLYVTSLSEREIFRLICVQEKKNRLSESWIASTYVLCLIYNQSLLVNIKQNLWHRSWPSAAVSSSNRGGGGQQYIFYWSFCSLFCTSQFYTWKIFDLSQVSNIKSENSQNVGLEDYNNISEGIFPHFYTPTIKISLG